MPNDASSPVLIVLGFDYGTKRIGVAVGNSLAKSAQALEVITNTNSEQAWQQIAQLIQEWQPNFLVVGLPLHPDGAEHAMTAKAKRFGRQLEGRFTKNVHYVDERYSSVLLEQDSQYQGAIDSHSAAMLVEQFLREQG
jgi:putative Holliday junction resolvase